MSVRLHGKVVMPEAVRLDFDDTGRVMNVGCMTHTHNRTDKHTVHLQQYASDLCLPHQLW